MNNSEQRMEVFLQSLETPGNPVVEEIRCKALEDRVPIIRSETASLLRFLIKSYQPVQILEVGCAVGYSAILMCEAMPLEGRVTTIENYEKRICEAEKNFERAGLKDRITLLKGDASEWLSRLVSEQGGSNDSNDSRNNGSCLFDFIFMDAAKAQYIVWLPYILQLLAPGGVLVTDNVLQEGDVLESRYAVTRRNRTIHSRMREYLYALKHTDGLETAVLNVGDGVALSYKEK